VLLADLVELRDLVEDALDPWLGVLDALTDCVVLADCVLEAVWLGESDRLWLGLLGVQVTIPTVASSSSLECSKGHGRHSCRPVTSAKVLERHGKHALCAGEG
jgi:hypothetical protein